MLIIYPFFWYPSIICPGSQCGNLGKKGKYISMHATRHGSRAVIVFYLHFVSVDLTVIKEGVGWMQGPVVK